MFQKKKKRIPSRSSCKPDLTVKTALHEQSLNVVFTGRQDKSFHPTFVPLAAMFCLWVVWVWRTQVVLLCRQLALPRVEGGDCEMLTALTEGQEKRKWVFLAENTRTPPPQGVLMSGGVGPGHKQSSPEPSLKMTDGCWAARSRSWRMLEFENELPLNSRC